MNKDVLIEKIDAVIASMKKNIEEYQRRYAVYSENFKELNLNKEENVKKYHYELEKYNYKRLKCVNELNRIKLFIKRCLSYKDYLNSLDQNNLLNIKKCEYQFIKNIQEETFFYYDSKIQELNQRRKIEVIVDRNPQSVFDIENLLEEKEKKLDTFQNKNFNFDEDKIYTTEYLDYDISKMVDKLYKTRRKKAS